MFLDAWRWLTSRRHGFRNILNSIEQFAIVNCQPLRRYVRPYRQFMADHDNRHAPLFPVFFNDIKDTARSHLVDPAHRFIQKQDVGYADERACDRDRPALPYPF